MTAFFLERGSASRELLYLRFRLLSSDSHEHNACYHLDKLIFRVESGILNCCFETVTLKGAALVRLKHPQEYF